MRLEDETYEQLMNSLTNHSFDMMRNLMDLEKQENYIYTFIVVLLVLLIFTLSAAFMKNTAEFKADLHRALERASNSRLQQMVELSSISNERGPIPIQSIEGTQ